MNGRASITNRRAAWHAASHRLLLILSNCCTAWQVRYNLECLTVLGMYPLVHARGSVTLAKSTRPLPGRDRQGAAYAGNPQNG